MEAAMLIGGEWRQAASNEAIDVVDPATEEDVESPSRGAVGDVDAAVSAAHDAAFPAWSRTDARTAPAP